MSKSKGGRRLNKRLALEVRQYAIDNPSVNQAEIGVRYGISREAVNRILNNVTYKTKQRWKQ